jgi:hypothetical protein
MTDLQEQLRVAEQQVEELREALVQEKQRKADNPNVGLNNGAEAEHDARAEAIEARLRMAEHRAGNLLSQFRAEAAEGVATIERARADRESERANRNAKMSVVLALIVALAGLGQCAGPFALRYYDSKHPAAVAAPTIINSINWPTPPAPIVAPLASSAMPPVLQNKAPRK